jgi:2-keto-3-deoxy-L-rhamnonate aldolase RhmA
MTRRSPWQSPVRRRLAAREPIFAITLTTPSLDVAARAAALGFDLLWVEMEHSPITLETLRHIVLVTRGLSAVPFARVPLSETWTAKRVLDSGVGGVIFPFVSTPDLARQAAAACRYPPAGRRGSGAGLAMSTWPEPERYYDSADENITVIAVIEEARALDDIDAIASTPGLDALFVGTSDLSFSLGYRGRQNEAKLEDAIEAIRLAADRHGKPAGRPAASEAQAREFVDRGYTLFQTASDLGFLEAGARRFLDAFGRGPRDPRSGPLY